MQVPKPALTIPIGSIPELQVAPGNSTIRCPGPRLQSEGYSIANDANENIPHDGNTDEEDGYQNSTVSGKFSFDVTSDFKISAVARYINSESDLDDYAGGYTGDNIGSTWTLDPVTETWVETSVANPDDPTPAQNQVRSILFEVYY